MATDADLGWAAGLIDGEGCIYLHARRNRTGYTLSIAVSNANPVNIQELHRILGIGSVALQRRKKGVKPQHRPVWRWQVSSIGAEIVLRAILPHLRGKREEARIGLLSRQLMLRPGESGGAHHRRNPNVSQLAWLQRRLAELKKEPSGELELQREDDRQINLDLGGQNGGTHIL